MGRGKGRLGRTGGYSPTKAEARGMERGGSGVGAAWRFRAREIIGGGRLEVGGGPDGWAPPVSHQGEKGGREGIGWLAGLGPESGTRAQGGVGPKGRMERKGKGIPFYFSNNFSNSFPNEFLNPISFLRIHSSHK